MKRLLLSALAMCLLFVSCTKEENSTVNNNEIVPSNISFSGKWEFSKIAENNDPAYSYPAGWANPDTQCENVPDYVEFKNGSTIVYGNADKNDSGCTTQTVSMGYSTTSSTLLIKNMFGKGNVTFTVTKNTATEINIKTVVSGKSWTYILTKVQ